MIYKNACSVFSFFKTYMWHYHSSIFLLEGHYLSLSLNVRSICPIKSSASSKKNKKKNLVLPLHCSTEVIDLSKCWHQEGLESPFLPREKEMKSRTHASLEFSCWSLWKIVNNNKVQRLKLRMLIWKCMLFILWR